MSFFPRRFAALAFAGLWCAGPALPCLRAQNSAAAPAAAATSQTPHSPVIPSAKSRADTLQRLGEAAPAAAADAYAPKSISSPQITGQENSGFARPLSVELKASTAHIVQGAVYGLDAKFTNNGPTPISIPLGTVALNVQPEMGPSKSLCAFPFPISQTTSSFITLQPGDVYTAVFDLGAHVDHLQDSDACYAPFFWDRLRKYVDFAPGEYTFSVYGVYCDGKVNALADCQMQHLFSETTPFPVSIDQAQIVLYAGLGGLLALLVTKFRKGSGAATAELHVPPGGEGVAAVVAPYDESAPPPPPPRRWVFAFHVIKDVLGAMLMSITITIIADRLSTTQFPVKVSIDDFWGALTVGFVSYFVGDKFLDQVLGTRTAPAAAARTPHAEPPPAVIAAAAPAPAD